MRSRLVTLAVVGCLVTMAPAGQAAALGCGPFPTRHAYAQLLGPTGHAAWTVPLPSVQSAWSGALAPLVGPDAAYVSADGGLSALSLADGHQLWRLKPRAFLYGSWLWQDTVVVLSGDARDAHQTFTGYNAATGAVRWQRMMPGLGVFNTQPQTSDGALAVIRQDGVLEALDLTTGHVRWAVREEKSFFQLQVQSPTAATYADEVLFTANGRLSAYDQATGRRLWNTVHLPGHPQLVTSGGLAVVYGQVKNAASPSIVVGVDLATGKERWRFAPKADLSSVSVGDRGVVVSTNHYPDYRDWFIDTTTGKALWHVDEQLDGGVQPIVQGGAVLWVQHAYAKRYPPVTLIDRDAGTGHVRWQVSLHGPAARPYGMGVVGDQVTLTSQTAAAHPKGVLTTFALSSGHRSWIATLKAIASGRTTVGAGLLVTEDDPANGCAA